MPNTDRIIILAQSGVTVLATHGCDEETFHRYECLALSVCPDVVIEVYK